MVLIGLSLAGGLWELVVEVLEAAWQLRAGRRGCGCSCGAPVLWVVLCSVILLVSCLLEADWWMALALP